MMTDEEKQVVLDLARFALDGILPGHFKIMHGIPLMLEESNAISSRAAIVKNALDKVGLNDLQERQRIGNSENYLMWQEVHGKLQMDIVGLVQWIMFRTNAIQMAQAMLKVGYENKDSPDKIIMTMLTEFVMKLFRSDDLRFELKEDPDADT